MTAHAFAIQLNDKPTITDCKTLASTDFTTTPATMSPLTLHSGDTLDWSVSGKATYQGVEPTFSQLFGLEILSCTSFQFGSSVDVTDFLGTTTRPHSVEGTDCLGVPQNQTPNYFYPASSFPLTVGTVSQPVQIQYKLWLKSQSNLWLADHAYLGISLEGTLNLGQVVDITLQPKAGTSAPTSTDACTNFGQANVAPKTNGQTGFPSAVGPFAKLSWKWQDPDGVWSGTTQLKGIEIDSQQVGYKATNLGGTFQTDPTAQPLTEFYAADPSNSAALSGCPCGSSSPVSFDSSHTSYQASNNTVAFDVGSLSTLGGLHDVWELLVRLGYTIWLTTTPAGGGSAIWWAYDPDLDLEKDVQNP